MSSSLITSNYVEEVNVDKVMHGAMRGLADGLDPDSAYLTPDAGEAGRSRRAAAAGDVGLELTRQYYLRVIAARDNSPAAKAGLRTGDYVRAINDKPTREMSVWEGMRALRGAPGSKVTLTVIRGNAADPHVVELTREAMPAVRRHRPHRRAGRRLRARRRDRSEHRRPGEDADRRPHEGRRHEADRRRPPHVERHARRRARRWRGCSSAKGTLAMRETKGGAARNDCRRVGRRRDHAAACSAGRHRHVGRRRALRLRARRQPARRARSASTRSAAPRMQKLIKLPDGSGLWLSTIALPHAAGTPLHEKGLEPTSPSTTRRRVRPAAAAGDPILDKAIERLAEKKAA